MTLILLDLWNRPRITLWKRSRCRNYETEQDSCTQGPAQHFGKSDFLISLNPIFSKVSVTGLQSYSVHLPADTEVGFRDPRGSRHTGTGSREHTNIPMVCTVLSRVREKTNLLLSTDSSPNTVINRPGVVGAVL